MGDRLRRIFDVESPVIHVLGKLGDLIVLNLLWMLCSLPVITIGAATTALYAGVFSVKRDSASPSKAFLRTFRSRFWPAVGRTALAAAAGMLLYVDVRFMQIMTGTFQTVQLGLVVCLAVLYFCGLAWLFPLDATEPAPLLTQLKRSLLCGVTRLPRSMMMAALQLLPWILVLFFFYYFISSLFVWLLIGFSGVALINAYLIEPPARADKESIK